MRYFSALYKVLKSDLIEEPVTLIRYIGVGVVGVIVGMVAIWSFTELLGLFYIVAGCISACLSIISDFFFNEVWTFSHRRRQSPVTIKLVQRFGKFATHKVAGMIIAVSILALFTEVVGLHYLVSNIIAILSSFIWNYTLSSLWVWRKRE